MFCKLFQVSRKLETFCRGNDAVNVKENIRQDFLRGGRGVLGVGGLRTRVASQLAPDTTEKTTQ